jgi:hypothetical protein
LLSPNANFKSFFLFSQKRQATRVARNKTSMTTPHDPVPPQPQLTAANLTRDESSSSFVSRAGVSALLNEGAHVKQMMNQTHRKSSWHGLLSRQKVNFSVAQSEKDHRSKLKSVQEMGEDEDDNEKIELDVHSDSFKTHVEKSAAEHHKCIEDHPENVGTL